MKSPNCVYLKLLKNFYQKRLKTAVLPRVLKENLQKTTQIITIKLTEYHQLGEGISFERIRLKLTEMHP